MAVGRSARGAEFAAFSAQFSVGREGERRDGTERQIPATRHCFSDDPPSPVGVESEQDGFAGNIGPTRFLHSIASHGSGFAFGTMAKAASNLVRSPLDARSSNILA